VKKVKQANEDIRREARLANVPQWQLAEAMSMHENQYYIFMRHELSPEEKAKIRGIIERLKEKEDS
jgi:hypothetical protein